jgi:hypothetical protein
VELKPGSPGQMYEAPLPVIGLVMNTANSIQTTHFFGARRPLNAFASAGAGRGPFVTCGSHVVVNIS